MYMLWHDDKTDETEPVTISHLFQNPNQKVAMCRFRQQRLPITAAPRDEVQCSGLVKAFQAPRHPTKIAPDDLVGACFSRRITTLLPECGNLDAAKIPTSGNTGQKWGTRLGMTGPMFDDAFGSPKAAPFPESFSE
jgi:hypothetical protein